MPDAIMLTNGDKIVRVEKINGNPIAPQHDLYQNTRTKELCNPDGTTVTGLDVANLLGWGDIATINMEITPETADNENHPNIARGLAQDLIDARELKLGEPPEILGGVWACTSCNTIRDMDKKGSDRSWRQVDKHYEHKCSGLPPQCGHFQAVQIYPEGSKPYPEFNEKKHVVGVDFGKKGVTTWVEAEIQEDGTYKILDEGQMPIGREYDLDHIFMHHPMDIHMAEEYQNIRDGARQLAKVILLNTPDCADRSVAIRKIREAVMTANAAIALKGRLFK